MQSIWGDHEVYRKDHFLWTINSMFMPVVRGSAIQVEEYPPNTLYANIKERFDCEVEIDIVIVENKLRPTDDRDRLADELKDVMHQVREVEKPRVLVLCGDSFRMERLAQFENLAVTRMPYGFPAFTYGLIPWEHLICSLLNRGIIKVVLRTDQYP